MAIGAGNWLPARTRITHVWVEDTPDGYHLGQRKAHGWA